MANIMHLTSVELKYQRGVTFLDHAVYT